MAKNANLYIRTEQEVKDEAEKIFQSFGVTITDAVNIFLRKSIMVRGIPFDLIQSNPNQETLNAMQEIENMISEKTPSKAESVDDFFENLGE